MCLVSNVIGFGANCIRLLAFLAFINPVLASERVFESAETSLRFVELYTSQGCYSCPPAERWMNQMVERADLWRDLIPINFHVDYWDYIGWRDPFARKVFSSRQRNYNRLGYTRNVATPGFVVNGKGWNGWFARQALPGVAGEFSGKIRAELNQSQLEISYHRNERVPEGIHVHAAILGFGIETNVPRGENAGKTLAHEFVVVGYHQAPMAANEGAESSMQWRASFSLPQTVDVAMTRQALVLWVSERKDPKPIQVLGGWL